MPHTTTPYTHNQNNYKINSIKMNFLDTIKFASAVVPIAQGGSPAIQTPAPMLSPPFPTCEGFAQAVDGDTCDSLALKAGGMDEFLRLNPGLAGGAGCESGNINPGYFYCVKSLPPAPDGKNKGSPPPGEQSRGEKPPEPTKEPEEEKPEPPNPTTMPVRECDFGDCWKSWIEVSTASSEDMLFRAHRSCMKLYTEPTVCTDMRGMDFPAPIKEGCDNCQQLISGCQCWLERGYHTYTIGYVYGDWDDVADWIDPNMKKRAPSQEEWEQVAELADVA